MEDKKQWSLYTGIAIAKHNVSDGISKGDSGIITAYLPEMNKFAVIFNVGWITFDSDEKWFLENFDVIDSDEMNEKIKLNIGDFIDKPIIRNDQTGELFNKMTDEELETWKATTEYDLVKEGVEKKFPEWNSAYLAKHIDAQIVYDVIKLGKKDNI